MKCYKGYITLNKNSRGCYILDTVKGCGYVNDRNGGCYNECYALKIAKRYKFDFSKIVKRKIKYDDQLLLFGHKDSRHLNSIIRQINNCDMPFVRIGEMGDPSWDWEHTINVCKEISISKKKIVIITKHFNQLPGHLLRDIEKMNIYINTSVSALDNEKQISHRLSQYNRLKKICNSALRIVSCDFNIKNKAGLILSKIQDDLFRNKNIIDTVFRVSLKNRLAIKHIINIKKIKFLASCMYASVFNKNTFLGYCNECNDLCGIGL